jgi:hypothetical protein
VESVIDYRVPPEQFSALAAFDGSVIAERTAGEVSARCHDEQANFLALNLMHDIVTGAKGSRRLGPTTPRSSSTPAASSQLPTWSSSGSSHRPAPPTPTSGSCPTRT